MSSLFSPTALFLKSFFSEALSRSYLFSCAYDAVVLDLAELLSGNTKLAE